MKSPLALDKETIKEFKIDAKADLDDLFKLSYVRAQIDEFKKVMYRNRVDLIISQDLIERSKSDKNEGMETKARENLANYRNVIKQMASAIEVMEQLKSELEDITPASE